jgi:hypothetical protein
MSLAQQPEHIQVVFALEVAPEQRELCDPPGPRPRNAEALSKRRPADARVRFDLVTRWEGGLGHLHRHADAALFAVLLDLAWRVALRLREQLRGLQSI